MFLRFALTKIFMHHLISNVYNIYQNIYFIFLCLGHSVGDTLHQFYGDLRQIWSFLNRWFQLYITFFSKTNTWGIIFIPMSIGSKQNIFFIFLCLGHSVSDTLKLFEVDLRKIWSFLNRWFQLHMTFFFKNEHLGHYLHFKIYKIKPKHFLLFLMPWSQHERHLAAILSWFAPNLIIFGPLVIV